MTHPTPYTAEVRHHIPGQTDPLGNETDDWGPPVEFPVITAAPGAMEEPGKPNRDLSLVAWSLICPPGMDVVIGERDLVVWECVEYPVNGRPKSFQFDPWQTGIGPTVVELTRAEG